MPAPLLQGRRPGNKVGDVDLIQFAGSLRSLYSHVA